MLAVIVTVLSQQPGICRDKFKVEEHGDPASGSPKGDDTDLSESTSVSDSKDRTSGKSGYAIPSAFLSHQ